MIRKEKVTQYKVETLKALGIFSGSPRTIGGLNDKIELQVKPDYEYYVSKWVDYSTKYGLGYLLSDGTAGLVFKDQTRLTLSPDGL